MTCAVFSHSVYDSTCNISKWGEGCERCVNAFTSFPTFWSLIIMIGIFTIFLYIICYLIKKIMSYEIVKK